MIERLAEEHEAAGSAVLVLEHDLNAPVGNRVDRFADAKGCHGCGVPWVMVDSGWRHACGLVDYEKEYRSMISAALGSPALADIEGSYTRSANDLTVRVILTNRTGRTLSFANWATLNVIVYECSRVVYTSRFVRAAGQVEIGRDLQADARAAVDMSVRDVPVRDWSRARVIVLADYRPEPTEARFVSLQAVEIAAVGAPMPSPVPTPRPLEPGAFLPVTCAD